jgi:hypothetical protein
MNAEKQPAVAGPLEPTARPRAAFEAWISAPPFERGVERFGENSAWPGNYRELDVDLAWQAWSDAMAKAAAEIIRLRVALHHVECGLAAAEEDRDELRAKLAAQAGNAA